MRDPATPHVPDPVTTQVLREQQLQAEGWVNGMRIAVLGVMALGVALYSSFIPPSLKSSGPAC